MSLALDTALEYAHKNQERFLKELIELCRIPSVSNDAAARADVQRAANWLAAHLHSLGMENVQVFQTPGHPFVFGENLTAGAGKPTVLFYGHYDVQPAEPLELWETPAFEPTIRGDYLYSRGAADMKSQIMISLKAVEALARTQGLPVNVKFIFEGEEETGSLYLSPFIESHKDLLACDFAINPDTGMLGINSPTITYGLRGLAYFELCLQGPAHDLHSGTYGGSVHNPAQVLCEVIAGMHDAQGRVTLPGFYDRVRSLSDRERSELARLQMDDAFYLEQTGAPALYGEAGYTPVERTGARPTLEVNGLLSGFTGEGTKTVLPAKAMAKISTRLVPDQDPYEFHQQLLKYLESHVPPTVKWELKPLGGFSRPSITNLDIPGVKVLWKALEETWGVTPMFRREGGSVPVVEQLQTMLGVESVLTGFALPDDNIHAPNERMHLPNYYRAIDAFIRYMIALGE